MHILVNSVTINHSYVKSHNGIVTDNLKNAKSNLVILKKNYLDIDINHISVFKRLFFGLLFNFKYRSNFNKLEDDFNYNNDEIDELEF